MLDASGGVDIMRIMLTPWMLYKPMSKALALGFFLMSCTAQKAERKVAVRKPLLSSETAGKLLSRFSEAARRRLEGALYSEHFDGVLESEVVKDVIRLEGGAKTLEQFMVDMLQLASLYSRPATSGFRVGAVCEGDSGNIYFGANLELAGAPLGFTIHAEQSAIGNALAHGEKAARSLAVTSAPCGHCRQFLNELTTASTFQVIIAGKPRAALTSLLPDSFGPADLGVRGGLFGQAEIPLTPLSESGDPLVEAALRAAGQAYSPYTGAYSGVALRLKDGRIIAGSYVESAAYNPSLSPILSAIDRLRFTDGQYSDISSATLIELENSKISQEGITRLILGTIAPGVKLLVVKARIAKQ